jgi:hypothetical protein
MVSEGKKDGEEDTKRMIGWACVGGERRRKREEDNMLFSLD